MNNNITNSQTNNSQPAFQWEAPVLYTEDWMKTLAGTIPDANEVDDYYTGI